MVVFDSSEHVHGNVFPNDFSTSSFLGGVLLLRVVPFVLKGVDAFCDLMDNYPVLWCDAMEEIMRELESQTEKEGCDLV